HGDLAWMQCHARAVPLITSVNTAHILLCALIPLKKSCARRHARKKRGYRVVAVVELIGDHGIPTGRRLFDETDLSAQIRRSQFGAVKPVQRRPNGIGNSDTA